MSVLAIVITIPVFQLSRSSVFNPQLKFIVEFKFYVMQTARGIFSRIFNDGGCFGCRNDGMKNSGFGSGIKSELRREGESRIDRGRGRCSVGGG